MTAPLFTKKQKTMKMDFLFRNGLLAVPALLLGVLVSGCDSQIYDDLDPCRTSYHLKFRYDYNMKNADAFPSEVRSVAVWAFDRDGKLVWQHSESGETLSAGDYRVDVALAPGKYDFVTWCGLSGESPFRLASPSPAAMTDLATILTFKDAVRAGEGVPVSAEPFTGLYNAVARGVEIIDNPAVETDNEIEFSLVKDTNYIKVLLQNLDGTVMKEGDFSVYITADNGRIEYDNAVTEGDAFHYEPWKMTYGEASLEGEEREDATVTSVSSFMAELHTSRLMKDAESRLVVRRNRDGKDIVRIPLVDYLLLVKGNYHVMGDQEYLDRQDEYSLTFFLDENLNWYREVGIYVNKWHVVPPQDETLH